jgi:organic radical activating enzyme
MDLNYPIAEIFQSLQGEGHWCGHMMTFIRFAGCNVGKPYTAAARESLGLNVYQERCSNWDRTGFPCDTNYRMTTRMSLTDLLEHELVKKARIVLLTGGEPLMHPVEPLIRALLADPFKRVHVETSGTKEIGSWVTEKRVWVAVSPKEHCLTASLYHADEIKVLVGPDFDAELFHNKFSLHYLKIRLFPINGEHSIDAENTAKCIELVRASGGLMTLGTQTHKVWGVR